jgi:hypothetical protein
MLFEEGSGIGEQVEKDVDLSEGIGQKKDPNNHQENPADEGDPSHIPFNFIEG